MTDDVAIEIRHAVFKATVRIALDMLHGALSRAGYKGMTSRLPPLVAEATAQAIEQLETALRESNWK